MTLDLPRFQVHGMRCGAEWVDLAAFSALYHVSLDETGRPVEYEVRSLPYTREIVHEFSITPNLGSLSGGRAYLKPVRERLRTRARGGGLFLEISAKTVSTLKKCELVITSRVIETDRNRREINARMIFQGRGYRECAE